MAAATPSYLFSVWERKRFALIQADRPGFLPAQPMASFLAADIQERINKCTLLLILLTDPQKAQENPSQKQQWIYRAPYMLSPKYSANFVLHYKQICRYISRKIMPDSKSIFRSVFKKGLIFTGCGSRHPLTSRTLSTFKMWNNSLFLLAFWTDRRTVVYIMLQQLLPKHTTQ